MPTDGLPSRQPPNYGFDRLRQRLPDLQTPAGVIRILGLPSLLFILIQAFFYIEDRTGGFWWLDGEVVILTLGFLSLSLFFRRKQRLLEHFGSAAYPLAFRRFFAPGLAIIISIIVRMGSIPGPMIPRFSWYPIVSALGWGLIAVGSLLGVRAVQTLGFDALTMSYVYLPENGELTRSGVYAVLRHPVYATAQWIGYGLALLNGSWFALTLAFIFSLGVWAWIRLVEERELIARLGVPYNEYRKQVPAFFPKFRDLIVFFRFLLMGR